MRVNGVEIDYSGKPLGNRERQICALVAEGLTNAQIAAELHVSPHTVKSSLRVIFEKTGATSRANLTSLLDRKVKLRTAPEVARVLTLMRADLLADPIVILTPDWYRRQGAISVLDRLIAQISAVPELAGRPA